MAIRGQMDSLRQAWVPLQIRHPDGQFRSIQAVVDTGYSGTLALPPDLIGNLELPAGLPTVVTLGNNVERRLRGFVGQILWHDRMRSIPILEARGAPLIGTRLLAGSQLVAQFRNGGEVVIEEIE